MATYDQQYRPMVDGAGLNVTHSGDDALDVKVVRDFADNVNNAKGRVFAKQVINCGWPGGITSTVGSTNEHIVLPFATRYVAPGYDSVVFTVQGEMNSGTCTWRLYMTERFHRKDYDDFYLNKGDITPYTVGSLVISSGTDQAESDEFDALLSRNLRHGHYHWFLTAENSTGAAQCTIHHLAASMFIEEPT
jgi:hypothetical protein